MTDTLPEIAVRDADDQIRRIYERIMESTGVGSPALIYRHFAVYPGFLEWVWDAFGSEFESGRITGHALKAVNETPVVSLPHQNITAMRATGIDDNAHKMIDAMLATYNRMNPVNLSLITAIRDLIEFPDTTTDTTDPLAPVAAPDAAEVVKLPAPLNLDQMSEELRDTVLQLSAAIPSPGTQVIPTLYRHLAIWPDFLAMLAPDLLDAMQRGDVEARMADLNAAMQPLIRDVTSSARARNLPPPPISDKAAMITTLNSFLYTIPQLVVVGTALRAALPRYEA